jgi:MFS family permease
MLFIREKVIHFYKTYERIVLPMVRFISMLALLVLINNQIGTRDHLMNPAIVFILSLVAGVCSASVMILLIMLFISIHLVTFNLMLGLTAVALFSVLYILFIRLYPKESLLILFVMLASPFNLQPIILLSAPLFGGIASAIAIVIGLILTVLGKEMKYLMEESLVLGEMKDYLGIVIETMKETILDNRTLLVTIAIFLVVFIVIYGIRKLSMDYSSYIAVGTGAVIHLLGFIMAALLLQIEVNVASVFIVSILGSMLAVFISFLSKPLDYTRGESVQFEDDDNYYYVKVVPKIRMRTDVTKVKQVYINASERNIEE